MTAVAIHQDNLPMTFDSEARQLISDSLAPGASPAEIEVFLRVAERVQLDPFRNQVWLIPRYDSRLRREVFKPQTSIDGMRLIAQRTGEYGGSMAPEWCDADGNWRSVWLDGTPPAAARFSVVRKDWKQPAVGIATWDEFSVMVGPKGKKRLAPMWQKMGPHMLAKCAEAQALRRAFPAEMAGLYTDDEMAATAEESKPQQVEATPIIDEDVKDRYAEFMALASEIEDAPAFKARMHGMFAEAGLDAVHDFSASNLTVPHLDMMIAEASPAIDTDEPAEMLAAFAAAHGIEDPTIEVVAEHLGTDVASAVAHIADWGQS